jgi:5,10-methylenetetrahydromethanopterin reductase
MRIHFVFEPCSAERCRDLGLLAERLGFDAAWLPNMLSARDPFMTLSLLARESTRIRVGPVAISPFELHPLKIANALLTLNEFSRGRASIVIGGGGGTMIGMGLKPDRSATHPRMVRGVRECIDILRGASASETFSYRGELFRLDGYQPAWADAPPPRLYVAANRRQMLRLAGAHGDGVMLSDVMLPHLPSVMTELRAGLRAAGRDGTSFHVNNLLAWHVKEERGDAYAEARRKLWVRGIWERERIAPYVDETACELIGNRLPALASAYQRGDDPAAVVPRAILDRLVDGLTLTGNTAATGRLVSELREFRAGGVTEVSLRLYGDPEASIRLVAERIAPALA